MFGFIEYMKSVIKDAFRMFIAPLRGAIDGIKMEINRPKSTNLRQTIINDTRLYFAPITGAIEGVKKEMKSRREAR